MPDGEFSESDYDSEVDDPSTIPESDDDEDDDEVQQLVEQGFEVCRPERIDDSQDSGSPGRRCAVREPRTQVNPCLEYLERSVGAAKIALMQELGVLDEVLEVLPIPSAMIVTSEEVSAVMALEDFVGTDILLTLDSGCCDHIVDMADAPGNAAVLHPSPGS